MKNMEITDIRIKKVASEGKMKLSHLLHLTMRLLSMT